MSGFSKLPPLAQTVISIVGVVTVIGIGVGIYFAIKKRVSLAGSFKETKEMDDAIKELAKKNIKPTWTPSSYLAAANQVHAALDGNATDEDVIYKIMERMKNDADMLSLMAAYGIREVKSGRLNMAENYKGTMAGAIADEFDDSEIKKANKILEKNGVTIPL